MSIMKFCMFIADCMQICMLCEFSQPPVCCTRFGWWYWQSNMWQGNADSQRGIARQDRHLSVCGVIQHRGVDIPTDHPICLNVSLRGDISTIGIQGVACRCASCLRHSRWGHAPSLEGSTVIQVKQQATAPFLGRGLWTSYPSLLGTGLPASPPPIVLDPYNPPPPQIGEESQQISGTNWRTNFSAKQVPGALDLSPRPQTHLPFGCSAVGVMWKAEICLNFQ